MQQENKRGGQYQELSQSEPSSYSSEDDDGVLLTNEVKEKLLTVVAKLKNKDPQIYKVDKPIFQEQDFQINQRKNKPAEEKTRKFTYKDLLAQKEEDKSDNSEGQNINFRPQDIKQKLKKNLNRIQDNGDDDLFKLKKKQKAQIPKKKDEQKMKDFVSEFSRQGSQFLINYWKNEESLDKTDLFLRNYIINERWKTSKMKPSEIITKNQQMIDEQDQVRSIEMDEYEANYNFRFQQPGSDKIVVYPRQIPESVRLKPESRKQRRKKLAQRKKQEQENIRKQFQQKKAQKKVQILQKINEISKQDKMEEEHESSDFDHDWFFCDDCAKALEQNEMYYVCNECGQYMLCEECQQIIIHKHQMEKATIPKGAGPPQTQKAVKALNKLKSCKHCKRKIPHYLQFYEYNDKSTHLINTLCSKCYDESALDIKKKFKLVQPKEKRVNYQEMLEANPERVKQLVTHEDVEELVDQYMKYDFEDIIAGGLKTKFKYITVKPEGYGLSDEQILYGDDRQLNKYVSIKKIGAYEDQQVKLRNNLYRRKIKSINRSASQNKKLVNQHRSNPQALRTIKKIQSRAELLRKRRQGRNTKLKIINISNPEDEKKLMVKKSRLQSYGLAVDEQKQKQYDNLYKKKKITKGNNN